MKFRIKCHDQTQSTVFDGIKEDSSVNDLKKQLTKQFSSLNNFQFHLSLNGKGALDDEQTISQSGLVNGDTIYILNDNPDDHAIILPLVPWTDQPLTLDEVRDSHTYPVLVYRLIEDSQPETDFDYLIIVLHALMLECGFQMDTENNYNIKSARKSSTFYVIRYRHKLCDEERTRCSLALMKTDTLVTIDGVVNAISQACGKLSLNIGDYLQMHKAGTSSTTTLPYRELRTLSRIFKDNIANRLLCKLLEQSRQCSTATLVGLPNEIKLRLAKYLPIKSICMLQLTCRDIHHTLNDNLLWHDLCVRDFDKAAITATSNTIENCSNEKNWHKLYGIIYAQKQASLRYQTKSSPYFHTAFLSIAPPTHRVLFPDPSNAGPAGFHPFPPAIYRPIPSGIFPATMIPLPPCFHHVWLG
ncbi:unnamed protein product [Adineta ricciae]|uniref:F-box domain-containing protein n=1 Tax=Adineta ricciae TaxID=249248 RepID=A0A813RHG9_ADIRI|nr:unnamed protein product [Adineta ricciae]